jgi:hypothetical protein
MGMNMSVDAKLGDRSHVVGVVTESGIDLVVRDHLQSTRASAPLLVWRSTQARSAIPQTMF